MDICSSYSNVGYCYYCVQRQLHVPLWFDRFQHECTNRKKKKNRHRRMPSINCIIELGAMRYMRHSDSPRHHSPERSIKLVGNWQTARLLIQKSIVYCTFNVLFLCPRYVPASTYLWPPNIRLHTYSSSIVRVFICLQFFFFLLFLLWYLMENGSFN